MKKYCLSLAIFLMCILFPLPIIFSEGLPPKEKLCPNGDCRGSFSIRLIKEDGSVYEQNFEYLYPVIQSNGITLFPGEYVEISGTFENGQLTNIHTITEKSSESPLITFKFWQEKANMMMLEVNNNSEHDIKYHLAMMPLTEESLFKTSSCPVLAGKFSFETWPHQIYQLLIHEIFIVDIGKETTCEY